MIRQVLIASCMAALLFHAGQRGDAQTTWPQGYSGNGQYQQPVYPSQHYSTQAYGYPQQQYGAPPPQPNPNPAQDYYGAPAPSNPYPPQGDGVYDPLAENSPLSPAPSQQPLNGSQLDRLVAPIALYPDALVAQILAASTYPAQIPAADQWLRNIRNAPPDQVAAAAGMQTSWDPSIKALTAFPQILEMLDQNLQWTTALGNAYYNQPQDVLQTVQFMRQRAEQAGNLQNTPQENVVQQQGYISVAPTNPDDVYVPTYNPWTSYGDPVSPYPGFSLLGALGSFFGSSLAQNGLSFALSAFNHTPFGLLSWGLDWLANSVLFNHSSYFTQSTSVADWGLPYGGPRAWRGGGPASARFDGGYQNYHHEAISVHGREQFNRGYNRGGERPYTRRGMDPYARGYQREGYGRSGIAPQEAFNRGSESFSRPQYQGWQQTSPARREQYRTPPAYTSPVQRQNFGGYPSRGEGFFGRQAPAQTYRDQPNRAQAYAGARGIGKQPSNAFSRSYSDKGHSGGGFHLFGGGHKSEGFSGGHSSHGGGFFGGHSSHGFGGGKAPKASHSGGGGGHGHGHSR